MVNNFEYKNAYRKMRTRQIIESQNIDLEEYVIDFLDAYPNPSDKIVHEFAEQIGVEVDIVEQEIYKLATKFVRFWKGGKSNTVKDFQYNEEQLKMGIEVELEHTPDRDVAEKIVKDHLVELPDNYYTLLDEMEKAAKE